MGDIEIRCMRVGMIQTNCYAINDKELKQAVLVDPGDNGDYLLSQMKAAGLKVAAILLTHGHSDHFKGLEEVKRGTDAPVYIPRDDAYRLKYQGGFVEAAYTIRPDDIMVDDNDTFTIGGMKIRAIHTPGHTEGGTCYYFEDNAVLISGDTLFCHSWGRTDFPGGDEAALFKSIREKLLVLPPETLVLPGHEGTTTIAEERRVHGFSA